MNTFSAQAIAYASCNRRQYLTIECEARSRDHAKQRFAKYRKIRIGDTRFIVRVDLRSVRQQKTKSPCLALRSQQLEAARMSEPGAIATGSAANSFSQANSPNASEPALTD